MTNLITVRSLRSDDLPDIESWYCGDGPDWTWLVSFSQRPEAFVRCAGEPVAGVVWCRCTGPEAEIIDIRIAPAARGQGIGSRLLATTLQALIGRDVTVCYLEVRASNEVARRLYRLAGFVETGIRRDYYPSTAADSGREDAILMTWRATEVGDLS